MKVLILSLALLTSLPAQSQEIVTFNSNRVCADLIGIPYASDNFSDEEWEKFQSCMRFFREVNGIVD